MELLLLIHRIFFIKEKGYSIKSLNFVAAISAVMSL